MAGVQEVPFILGGHSFIQQLGNDPIASPDVQVKIVQACLDAGIRWFDTTYQPERIALGRALKQLGRRSEAVIIAWNFFVDFVPGESTGSHAPYEPQHIDLMLRQLQTDRIDCLVVHPVEDQARHQQQLELAIRWKEQGLVKRLGTWWPGTDVTQRYAQRNPYSFMVRPYNVTTADAPPVFAACKAVGWETCAASPFVRGWELDKMVKAAVERGEGTETELRPRLADRMLRYSLFAPNVDRVIVAMRRVEWVQRNVESYRRGPLKPHERIR